MIKSETTKLLRKKLATWLENGLISQAIGVLESEFAKDNCGEEQRNIAAVRQLYELMSSYALDGASDASRTAVMARIRNSVIDIVDAYERRLYVSDSQSSSLYASTLRTQQLLKNSLSLRELANSLDADPTNKEHIRNLFNHIWLTHPLTGEDKEILENFYADTTSDNLIARQLAVGALFLGEIMFHDDFRLSLLSSIYSQYAESQPVLALKALTALCMAIMYHAPERKVWRERLATRLSALSAVPTFHDDLKTIVIQIVRARDTERISRHITSDIIPSIIKLNKDKIKFDPEMDLEMLEEHPEWMEPLEDLTRMQEEGSDIMMSTFAPLKSLPFFNDIYAWFLPFDETFVPSGTQMSDNIRGLIEKAKHLCDSDKYSLAMAMSNIPKEMVDKMKEQLGEEFEAMNEQTEGLSESEMSREETVRNYVRSLHRFFTLFRRKNEFPNPFVSEFSISPFRAFDTFGAIIDISALSCDAADFLFSKRYYDQALPLYLAGSVSQGKNADTLEKIAYCYQQTGDYRSALDYYNRASFLSKATKWRLRRMAACHRMLGNFDEAVKLLKQVMDMTKEPTANLVLSLANHLSLANRNDEALPMYFRVEYLDPQSKSALRAILWLSLLEANFDRAQAYAKKIFSGMDANPEAGDYINRAHLNLLTGNPRLAAKDLRKAYAMMGVSTEKFIETVNTDFRQLEASGLDTMLACIVLSHAINNNSNL